MLLCNYIACVEEHVAPAPRMALVVGSNSSVKTNSEICIRRGIDRQHHEHELMAALSYLHDAVQWAG